MKNDRLERFISENRQDFETHEPSEEVWEKVRRSAGISRTSVPGWLKVASVLILVCIAMSAAWFLGAGTNRSTARLEKAEESIPELKEAEIYYNGMIYQKLNEIEPHLTIYPGLMDELTTDFSNLDSIYSDLRNDLKDRVCTEEVVQALIQNYRIKLQMLEELLEKINNAETDKENKKNHEI
jgi:hypothetical protein